jgi:hypothetical protein
MMPEDSPQVINPIAEAGQTPGVITVSPSSVSTTVGPSYTSSFTAPDEPPPTALEGYTAPAIEDMGGTPMPTNRFKFNFKWPLLFTILIVMGTLSITLLGHLVKNSPSQPASPNQVASSPDNLNLSSNVISLQLNRDTVIGLGKKLTASGQVAIKNDVNSPTAFQVQNAKGGNLLVADTTNNRIGIGGAPTGSATLQVIGNISGSGSLQLGGGTALTPTSLVINSVTVCTSVGCTFSIPSQVTSQGNNFNGPNQLIKLSSTGQLPDGILGPNIAVLSANQTFTGDNTFAGKVLFQNAVNGSSNFAIQKADGSGDLFVVDTAAGKVGIGRNPLASTAAILQVNGSIDLTGQVTFNGTQINSFNLADSANIARLDTNQTFIGNNTFTGNLTVLNLQPSGSTLTVGSTTSQLALQGSLASNLLVSDGTFNVQVGFSGIPTGNLTYNFDAAASPGTYDICTTVGNCVGSGGAVATPGGTANYLAKFTGPDTVANSSILDNGLTVSISETAVFRAGSDSATAFRVQNATGLIDLLVADTTDSRVGIGLNTGNVPQYPLDVAGDVNSSTGLRVGGNLVCTSTGCSAGTGSGFYIQNGTALQTANFAIQSSAIGSVAAVVQGASGQTADLLDVRDGNGVNVLKVSNTGSVLIQPSINSVAAFQIQNAAGNSNLLVADTTQNRIGIGIASPAYALDVNGDVNVASGSVFRINGVSICGPTANCAPAAGSSYYIQNGTALQTGANFNISSGNINSVAGTLRGALGQVADIMDLQDGSGNNIFTVGPTGSILAKTTTNSTAAFQIQNSAGTSNLFVADTTNSKIGIGTASPTATLNVNGTGLFQATAVGTSNSLTVSGNEITDTSRTANLQGDGRAAPDSSYGIWEGTTNMVLNGGFEANANSWVGFSSGTITRDTTTSEFGTSSMKVTTPGTVINEGVNAIGGNAGTFVSGQTYTFSVWLKGTGTVRLEVSDSSTQTNGNPITLTNTWTRYSLSKSVSTNFAAIVRVVTTTTQATTFWMDGAQLEQKSGATPYVETNGTTATRNASTINISPSIIGNSPSQFWIAARVRVAYAASAFPHDSQIFHWTATTGQDLGLSYRPSLSAFQLSRRQQGQTANDVNSSAQTFNAGDYITLVGVFTPTQIGLSVNGSSFTMTANTNIGGTYPGNLNIGYADDQAPPSQAWDSDILWMSTGTGALTNTDATNINAFGNTDPNLNSFAGATNPTFVWQANNATYQYPGFQPIVFQVQNSSGSQLLGIDASASAILLPNSTSSTAALILGNDSNANLYRSAASTIKTDGNFQAAMGIQAPALDTISSGALALGTINATAINLNQNTTVAAGKSLTANGTTLFKNSVDSTTALQIQNAAGTSNLLVADTTNSRIGIGTATPTATLTVNGSGLIQASSTSNPTLTVSGNELTDATRTANVQGDARAAPDSSYGIWEATTNLVTNGGFESNITGWTNETIGGDGAIVRITTDSLFGSSSLKLTGSTGTQTGARYPFQFAPNTTYTVSAWARVISGSGSSVQFFPVRNSSPQVSNGVAVSGSTWQRYTFTFTTDSSTQTADYLSLRVSGTPTTPYEIHIDGVQIEQKVSTTPYVETNGASASRNVSRIQAPASIVNTTQGWFAARVRLPYTSSAGPAQNPRFFSFGDNTNNRLELLLTSGTSSFSMLRAGAGTSGSVTFNQTFNAGDMLTLIGYWTSGSLGISINGSNFATGTQSVIPTLVASVFNIGSDFNGTSSADGDILWTAAGTGTLTNVDATNINSFGNTDPGFSSFPGFSTPTMVWQANNSNYINSSATSPLVFNVQNSIGSSLFNIDSNLSSVNLQNATSSLAALVLGNDANLYRASAQTLKTDTNLTVGNNLTVSGAGTFKNTADSTTAFQIQNSAGTSNLLIADTTNSRVGIGIAPTTGFQVAAQTLFKPAVNSVTSFQIQNSTGTSLLTTDSVNSQITLGQAGAVPVTLVLGNKNTVGDPATGVDGEMYYNSSSNAFRCHQAGVWVNCTGAGGGGGGGGDVNQGGNSFGTSMVLGTNDNNMLSLRTNAINVMTLGTNGSALFQNSVNSSTAFQIQNSTGTSNLFVADTTNSRVSIGTNTGTGTLNVSGSGLFQQSAVNTLLTVSGNEITDASRTINTQGDGRTAPDSSYGIWEGTTNQVPNGGFESNITGWGTGAGSPTFVRDTTTSKFGSASLKFTSDGADSRVTYTPSLVTNPAAGTTFTMTAWVKAGNAQAVGHIANIRLNEIGGVNPNAAMFTPAITLTNSWQRITGTGTVSASDRTGIQPFIGEIGGGSAGDIIFVDGIQVEQKAYATPYVETNGTTASRAGARVQVPIGSMNTSQGWMAIRVRLGFPSTVQPGNPTPLASLAIDSNNRMQIVWQGTTAWGTRRVVGGVQDTSATINDSFNIGDYRTVILAWTASTIGLSVNGSNFTTVSSSSTFTPTSFDIGSISGGGQADSDFLWFASGTGTLNNTDASSINAFGNTDPSLSNFPGGGVPVLVWQANTANYVNSSSQPTVLSVQNSAGTNLLSVDAASSQLTASTSALFKNVSNNATALQVQNASGINVFGVDTNNGLVNLGTPGASGTNGQIVFNSTNAGNFGVTIGVSSSLAASYTLKLPNAAPSQGQCLQVDAIDASQLNFATCAGGGGSSDLQGVYNNSTSPATIATTSTAKGVIIKAGLTFDSANLFQVQNSTGTTILNVDSANSRIGINTSTPLTTLNVNGTDLIQGTSSTASNFTVSGNEITDAVRVQNYQGDGRTAPDSSVGIWEATTNLITNGGIESNTAGWSSSDGVATLSRDTSLSKFGNASLKVAATTTNGVRNNGISVNSGAIYTESAWVNAPSGAAMVMQWVRADFSTVVGSTAFTGTGTWQRVSVTVTAPATETEYLFVKGTVLGAANTFWIDGVQIEQKTAATPYVETNGATATRNAARIQAPATGNINTTQGWAALRVRMGFSSSQAAAISNAQGASFRLFDYEADANNRVLLVLSQGTSSFTTSRQSGGVGNTASTSNMTWNAGDIVTVVAKWDAGNVYVSFNGAIFTAQANTTIPTVSSSLFDIGSNNGGNGFLDSDILWSSIGTGTISNSDVTTINNFGNTDPYTTNFSQAASPTLVWHANNSSYQLGNSLAFQVQNSSGANLFNINSANSSLIAGTSTKFQNLTDSASAFQIQNAAGNSNLFVADTGNSRLGIGTATPVATVNVVGSNLIQQGANTSLLTSGNEVTDATRTANTQGDGKTPPDSSYGVWEGTTNLALNGGGETDANSWTAFGAGASVARSTTTAKFGSASLLVAGSGTNANVGAFGTTNTGLNLAPGTVVSMSGWVKGIAGQNLVAVARIVNSDVTNTDSSDIAFTTTGSWQYVSGTITVASGKTGNIARLLFLTRAAQTFSVNVDGLQIEQKAITTPYVETNGATASRSAARIQAPASTLNTSQGWFATRMRMGFSSTVGNGGSFPRVWDWQTDTNNRYTISWNQAGAKWQIDSFNAGVNSNVGLSNSFNIGDMVTIIGYWNASGVGISVNGSSFAIISGGTRPTITGTAMDIGQTNALGGTFIDSDVLWAVTGTGAISNTDAISLNNFGNTDPAFSQLPATGTPTMVWKANTATYNTSSNADLVLQAKDNLNNNLLSLDATNSKLTVNTAGLFQNNLNSANAFTVNNSSGAQLFNVNTSSLQVSASNLQSSGAVNLTNANGTVSLAGSLQSTSALTVSGNEITDLTRTTNTQGDGRGSPDSSYGIWEGTTNLTKNGGAETNIVQASFWSSGTTTITRDTSQSKFGSASFKIVTDGTAVNQGIVWNDTSNVGAGGRIAVNPSTSYTFSAWVRGNAGGEAMQMGIGWYGSGSPISTSVASFTATNGWVKYTVTGTSPAGADSVWPHINTQGTSAYTLWTDGAQLEQKAYATPYVETNGAIALRNMGAVQAPLSGLTTTQGWFAARIRIGYASPAPSYNPAVFTLSDGTANNKIGLYPIGSQWQTRRTLGGNLGNFVTLSDSWSAGDYRTVVVSWTATTISLSINGTTFASVANAGTFTPTMLEIGNNIINGQPFDGDILWTATGTGTLSNTDATTLNAFGNNDPTLAKLYSLNGGAGNPTFVWNGNTANYQDAISSNGQALIYAANTSGATTGNLIDLQSGAFPSSRFSIDVTGKTTLQNSVDSTTAFQIQNAAGTSNLLVADTTNTRIGIGTAVPTATLTVNGTGLIQASTAANPQLTVSGSEITDSTRTSNSQGDGRTPPDSSYGVWEATTNLVINGGIESNTTGWIQSQGGETLTRVTTDSKFGTASIKVDTGAVGNGIATQLANWPTATAGQVYTGSAWVKGVTGRSLQVAVFARDEGNGNAVLANSTATVIANGNWQRVTTTLTTPAAGVGATGIYMSVRDSVLGGNTTFYADGMQLEQKSVASPYVETNGSTSTRGNSRVQASSTLLSQTQGWFTARVRPGFAAASAPAGFQDVMTWNDSSINNGLQLIYRTSDKTWRMRIVSNGSALGDATSAVQSFNAGDTLTITGYWTATQAGISVNGGAFITLSLTLPTFTNLPSLFDIGSQLGSSGHFDGDILWAASGTGTLTNTDAININNFGNTDPGFSSFSGASAPTFAWRANTSSYVNSTNSPLVFNVQNSSGASLLNVDTDLSSVNLQNATSSIAALVLGNDANLYRASAQTLKTDTNLTVGNNLTVSGAVLMQNSANSITALQVKTSAGISLLTADTSNTKIGIGAAPSATDTSATLQVAGTSSVQQTAAASALTVSGNEITDTSRAANTQGDGRKAPDSSYGVWEPTTNMISNGGLETNVTGWTTAGSNTIARDTTKAKFGSASLKATYQNNIQLAGFNNITVTNGQTYTASAWTYIPDTYNGTQPQLEVGGSTAAIPLGVRNSWQRVTLTFTASGTTTNLALVERGSVPTVGSTINLDGIQLEQKVIASPYVETNGAAANRAAARVQIPATKLNNTQGWVSTRMRLGFPSTQTANVVTAGGGTQLRIMSWQLDVNNRILVVLNNTNQLSVYRLSGGVGAILSSSAITFNQGDLITVTAAWDAANLYVSVNGAAFTSLANSSIPSGLPTTIDIGTQAGAGGSIDSDFLWTATGTGTLTNSDAAALNAFGNSDPDLTAINATDASAAPSMVWKANGANYQDKLAFSVQSSTGAGLLNIDAADSSILLPNATSSVAALVLGRDANLYRVSAQTLKTDGGLSIGNNLTVNGSALLQNAINSTTALQLQNSSGSSLFTADTVNSRIAINQATATYTLDVAGDINATGIYRVNGIQLASANLSDSANIAKLNVSQTFTGDNIFSSASNSFTGNGSGLTVLNGSNISSGTIADARLSNNVALLNGTGPQTFTGNNAFTGTAIFKNAADSASAVQIQNSAGTSNLFMADTTDTRIGIAAAAPAFTLDVGGDVNSSGIYRINGVQITSSSLADAGNIAYLSVNNTFTGDNTFNGSLTAGGAVLFKNTANSVVAFQVQNSSGNILLAADTTNMRLYVGNPAGETTGTLLVLANKTTAGDPAGTNGSMYYNANSGKFRCYENGVWANCLYGAQTVAKSADQTFSTTSYGDVTDVGFAVGANKSYVLQCSLLVSVSGVGGYISMNGPASPSSYTATFLKTSDQSAGEHFATSNIYDDGNTSSAFTVSTTSTGTNKFILTYQAILANGSNAGTWQLRAKAASSGTITLYKVSTCDMRPF